MKKTTVAILTAGICFASSVGVHAQIIADHADDVCAPSADPCVISQVVQVQQSATLDFGTRTVLVSGSGRLDLGSRFGTILCGSFTLDVGTNTGIDAKEGASGSSSGGFVRIVARRACSGNTEVPCQFDATCASLGIGACSVGAGAVVLNGRVIGSADDPAGVDISAAGDITVERLINLNGLNADADGGFLSLDSVAGSVVVNERITATGGTFSEGGEVSIFAGGAVVLNAPIDLNGGESDGGTLEVTADGNVEIHDDISLNANASDGFGGTIEVSAGGDILISGGTSGNRLVISANGSSSTDGFGGDGGLHLYEAAGSFTMTQFVRLESNGALPDGFGDEIEIDAAGDVVVGGIIESKGRGGQGAGGPITLNSDSNLQVSSTASFVATGGDSGGGGVEITASRDVTYDGNADVSASNGGSSGSFVIDVGRDVTVSGGVFGNGSAGLNSGVTLIQGCVVDLVSGADLDNRAASGENRLISRTRLFVRAGATVSASGSGGQNNFVYRDPGAPPAVSGSVAPAASASVDGNLPECPACGNGVIDTGETCDDGNFEGGDGCSFACQNEGCIADTPGFPSVALCDDGQECSADSCNAATSRCEHVFPCDDGIDCTVESCNGQQCLNTASDARCNDADGCTQGTCSPTQGCQFTVAPDGSGCDDGVFCNGTDSCVAGECTVHAGDPCPGVSSGCAGLCNESGDSCLSPAGTACESDGNVCTDDVCDGRGACVHEFNLAPCDDGVFCNGTDICVAGSCSFHAGNPCAFGPQCANACNEIADTCNRAAGTTCSFDSEVCTDDVCDGAGACVANPNTAPCNDGDYCTLSDQCTNGSCGASDATLLLSARFKVKLKSGADNDRLVFKADMSAAALTSVPTATGMDLRFFNAQGAEFYAASVPASAFEEVGTSHEKFRFRDKEGLIGSANGTQQINVRISSSKGRVRVKAKARERDFPGIASQFGASVSVLFGSDPATDDCATGKGMFCSGSLSTRNCKTR